MHQDICGCEISLTSAEAVAEWNAMTRAFLSHGASTPQHLGAVFQAAPDFAMAHAAKGLFSIMLGRSELTDVARDAYNTARIALNAGSATSRERRWVAALGEWLNDRPRAAIGEMEAILRDHPNDTLSMKVSQAIRFMVGDAPGMRRSAERVLEAHNDHPLQGYVLGCLSFAQEETGDYTLAEATGLRGLELAPDDAWGLHAVAHVHDMTNRPLDGINLIDQNASAWSHCNNFRFHVWWHKALLHLDQGDIATVLALYDEKIRADKTDDYRDFSNASSLLVRLELEGVDVGDRWGELADLAEKRLSDGCLAFADLHYMLALTGDDRPDAVDRMTARIARDAGPQSATPRIMAHPGILASEGLAAFGEGQYGTAFDKLVAAREVMQTIGGSHAQRDVFERITIDAGIRAGQLAAARRVLEDRIALRAGHEDAFAASRIASINSAQTLAQTVAAQ